jgi:hypothetical protein
MKNKQPDHAHANLPDERSDRLVRHLTELYSVNLPAGLSWTEIEQKHRAYQLLSMREGTMQQPTTSGKNVFPAKRKQWSTSRRWTITAAALLVAVLFTAAAVVTPPLRNLFNQDPQAHRVLNQFIELQQSQTVNGVTVQLEAAYADSNVVIIGYSITAAEKDVSASFTAVTPQGQVLSEFNGAGSESDWSSLGSKETNASSFITFNTSDVLSPPQAFTLHLTGEVGHWDISQMKLGHKPQILGKLSFEVSVPLHQGKILTPHQRVTVHGRATTLERVVITPTLTSIFISGFPEENPDPSLAYEVPSGTLDIQNKSYNFLSSGPDEAQGNGTTWVLLYPDDLSQLRGMWKLTVAGGLASSFEQGGPGGTIWTFQFAVS